MDWGEFDRSEKSEVVVQPSHWQIIVARKKLSRRGAELETWEDMVVQVGDGARLVSVVGVRVRVDEMAKVHAYNAIEGRIQAGKQAGKQAGNESRACSLFKDTRNNVPRLRLLDSVRTRE